MPQSDRNNGLFHCPHQDRDGEVHHGKQTGRQACTVNHRYLREASHKPRQQATALSDYCRLAKCNLPAAFTHFTLFISLKLSLITFWKNLCLLLLLFYFLSTLFNIFLILGQLNEHTGKIMFKLFVLTLISKSKFKHVKICP